MAEDFFRKWYRRDYLRRHAVSRRAAAKARGERCIDVTLRGESLDGYATVRGDVERLNWFLAERTLRHLSDNEIIRRALSLAAEEEDKAKRLR